MMTRTQKAIADYLAKEKLALKEQKKSLKTFEKSAEDLFKKYPAKPIVKLEPSRQPMPLNSEITTVNENKFNNSVSDFSISPSDRKAIYGYIHESPRANQHYLDYVRGKKQNFRQLVQNMTR